MVIFTFFKMNDILLKNTKMNFYLFFYSVLPLLIIEQSVYNYSIDGIAKGIINKSMEEER